MEQDAHQEVACCGSSSEMECQEQGHFVIQGAITNATKICVNSPDDRANRL